MKRGFLLRRIFNVEMNITVQVARHRTLIRKGDNRKKGDRKEGNRKGRPYNCAKHSRNFVRATFTVVLVPRNYDLHPLSEKRLFY